MRRSDRSDECQHPEPPPRHGIGTTPGLGLALLALLAVALAVIVPGLVG